MRLLPSKDGVLYLYLKYFLYMRFKEYWDIFVAEWY